MSLKFISMVALAAGLVLGISGTQAQASDWLAGSNSYYNFDYGYSNSSSSSQWNPYNHDDYDAFKKKLIKIVLGSKGCGKYGYGGHGKPDYCHHHSHYKKYLYKYGPWS